MAEDREQGGEIIVDSELLRKGFVQVPVVVLQDPDLTAGAKLAYGALLWYAWRERGYPGQATMGTQFGMSERSVRAYLGELVNRGYLSVTRPGQGRANTYRVLCPWEQNPDRQNLPVKAAKSAGQGGKSRRSLRVVESLDVKDETEQQQDGAAVVASQSPTPNGLAARLEALGVAKSTASKLLKDRGEELVYRWLCYAEDKLERGWIARETPAAFLVAALRNGDWVLPDWFATPEEKAKQEASRRQSAREERARREAAEEAARAEEIAALAAIEILPRAHRERLENECRATLPANLSEGLVAAILPGMIAASLRVERAAT